MTEETKAENAIGEKIEAKKEIKIDEPVTEKIEVKKETNSGLANFIWSIFFSSMAIIITVGTAIYFNNKVTNLYEENLQIYSNFIETLEAVDNDPNSDLVIKFNQLYAKGNSNNNQLKEPSVLKESFMADYYQTQSNWLNTWLSALGIILAIFGIIIPVIFIRFYDDKKEEITQLCNKIEEMRKEYKGDLDKLIEKTTSLQNAMAESIKSVDDAKKEMENNINKTMGMMAKDIEKARKYADASEKSENKSKAYSLFSQAVPLVKKDNSSEEEFDKAIKLLDEAISLYDEDSDFYYVRGNAFFYKEQYENAINDYDKTIKINPNNASGYSNKGISLDRIKKHKEALDMHNKSIELRPDNAISFYNRSACYCHLKQYEKAIIDSKKAYSISNDKEHLYNLIEAYIFNGNIKEALETLELFIDNNPSKFIIKDDINLWTSELNKYPDDKNAEKILELIKNLPQE